MDDRGTTERWIVGTDDSDGSLAALRWAARHSTGRPVRLESVRAESKSVGSRAVNTIMRLLNRARRSVGENAGASAELAGLVAGMGSVSTWLLADSPCPVVVVPDPAES